MVWVCSDRTWQLGSIGFKQVCQSVVDGWFSLVKGGHIGDYSIWGWCLTVVAGGDGIATSLRSSQ